MNVPLPRRAQDFTILTGTENAILRQIAKPVKHEEMKAYVHLGKEMVRYVKNPDNGCIGLAAPQIGISRRLIAVGLPPSWDEWREDEDVTFPYVAMINPLVIERSEELCNGSEGCLSLPWEKITVPRPKSILVEYTDIANKKQRLKLENFAARVVLHEIDHLDGILMVDRDILEHEQKRAMNNLSPAL